MKKTDLDEMIENPNEGLQVPENYLEVFTESPTTKPSEQRELDAVCDTFIVNHVCALCRFKRWI